MKKHYLYVIILLIYPLIGRSQVKAGPMLGYSEMREVLVWLQTEKNAKVRLDYWIKGNEGQKFSTKDYYASDSEDNIVHLIADEVLPGNNYIYEVFVDNKKVDFLYPLEFQTQTLWQFRSDPPPFSFVFGSCAYTNESRFDRPGIPYGKDSTVFRTIYEKHPNFMLWGGDNVYFREPDWNTHTGMIKRYEDFRSQPILQPLLANVHHYAIWDDHDYGPNDSDRSFWGKDMALDVFKKFWGNLNYIFKDEAVTGTFFWEDCQFFLLDDRWFRAPNRLNDPNKPYFGDKQIDWLIDALKSSQAPFKFIVNGGQILNSVAKFETMATFPGERQKLLDRLEKEDIWGLVFLTGDRHHSNMQELRREGNYPLYELTSSAMSAGSSFPTEEELKSSTLIEGTQVNGINNFCVLEVSGERKDRILKIKNFDFKGNLMFEYIIKANDLRKPKK